MELLNQVANSKSEEELRFAAGRSCSDTGFPHWRYYHWSEKDRAAPPKRLAPAAVPKMKTVESAAISALACILRNSTTPAIWPGKRLALLTPQLARLGFLQGIAVPCHGPGPVFGLALLIPQQFSGTASDPTQQLPQALMIASHMHEARTRLQLENCPPSPHLTSREQECLSWCASGKTSWEIGRLLGISERTVVFHLKNAAQKLGVNSRLPAVARAVSLGLIESPASRAAVNKSSLRSVATMEAGP